MLLQPTTERALWSGEAEWEWENSLLRICVTVHHADENLPLRAYVQTGEEQLYLGLLEPHGDRAEMERELACPFSPTTLVVTLGRLDEGGTVVLEGKNAPPVPLPEEIVEMPEMPEIPEIPLVAGQPTSYLHTNWERKTEEDLQDLNELEQFLFFHPSVQANLKFYDHFAFAVCPKGKIYAFASTYGPHALPHLAKYAYWHDVDLGFGHRGYFLIGVGEEDYFFVKE